jgi:hypothetical protein
MKLKIALNFLKKLTFFLKYSYGKKNVNLGPSINIIIFSKDRACQLELLLRSMKKHWKESFDHRIKVLYTYSDNEYKCGYDILITEYNDVLFKKEAEFKISLLELIDNKKYTVFFVDDDVFKEDFSIKEQEISIFETKKEIICLSLRLHPRLTYCYTLDIEMRKTDKNIWLWGEYNGDYGYPMSLDGHVFRTKEIKPLLKNLNYYSPNSLESELSNKPINLPYLMCFDQSKIINNPCNIVQNSHKNRHGNTDGETLNKRFILGERIILDNITGIENISCHQEIPIILNKTSTQSA